MARESFGGHLPTEFQDPWYPDLEDALLAHEAYASHKKALALSERWPGFSVHPFIGKDPGDTDYPGDSFAGRDDLPFRTIEGAKSKVPSTTIGWRLMLSGNAQGGVILDDADPTIHAGIHEVSDSFQFTKYLRIEGQGADGKFDSGTKHGKFVSLIRDKTGSAMAGKPLMISQKSAVLARVGMQNRQANGQCLELGGNSMMFRTDGVVMMSSVCGLFGNSVSNDNAGLIDTQAYWCDYGGLVWDDQGAGFSLRVSHSTGGTFTIIYEDQVTAPIAWNAAPAAVQSALEALPNIAPGDVAVTLMGPTFGGILVEGLQIEFLRQFSLDAALGGGRDFSLLPENGGTWSTGHIRTDSTGLVGAGTKKAAIVSVGQPGPNSWFVYGGDFADNDIWDFMVDGYDPGNGGLNGFVVAWPRWHGQAYWGGLRSLMLLGGYRENTAGFPSSKGFNKITKARGMPPDSALAANPVLRWRYSARNPVMLGHDYHGMRLETPGTWAAGVGRHVDANYVVGLYERGCGHRGTAAGNALSVAAPMYHLGPWAEASDVVIVVAMDDDAGEFWAQAYGSTAVVFDEGIASRVLVYRPI